MTGESIQSVERDEAVKVICNAKPEYFNDAIDANKNNSKSMYHVYCIRAPSLLAFWSLSATLLK